MITRSSPLKADSIRVVELAIKVSPSGDDTVMTASGKYIILHAESGEVYGSGSFNEPGKNAEASLREAIQQIEEQLANILFRGSPTPTTTSGTESEESIPEDDVPGL